MRTSGCTIIIVLGFMLVPCLPSGGGGLFAHCDTLEGPVVQEAKVALEKGEVTPVLKWVRAEDEPEIREDFERTLEVRRQGGDVQELADRYFFETLVRVHRAGEGEPYVGLKPIGEIEPDVEAADRALAAGSVDDLAERLSQGVREAIHGRFVSALERRAHADESVVAGREFVEAYVEYVHFIDGLHQLLSREGSRHQGEATRAHDH